ncbi:Uncharacterised protein [Mycobacteroides abscessus subsp. abscessus]|nr:Uncharacterised protein [Mycobacteroides abscessus subsp. abscessus]
MGRRNSVTSSKSDVEVPAARPTPASSSSLPNNNPMISSRRAASTVYSTKSTRAEPRSVCSAIRGLMRSR